MVGMKTKTGVKKSKVVKKKAGAKSAVKSAQRPGEKPRDPQPPQPRPEGPKPTQHEEIREKVNTVNARLDEGRVRQTGETQLPTEPKDDKSYDPEQQMAGTEAVRKLGMEHTIVRS